MHIQLEHARLVLGDCRHAFGTFGDGLHAVEWRTTYYLLTSLLRSVGYVLKNVEAAKDPLIAEVIQRRFEEMQRSKPEPAIFWSFIDSERHLLLKEYTSSARWALSVNTPTTRDKDCKLLITGPTVQTWKYEIVRGPFAGRDQRELISEALDWWERYIESIESEAGQRFNPTLPVRGSAA